jgi:predicted nucleic acid-binding protein
MIVLDASAALELLLGTTAGTEVRDRIASSEESLHAPHVFDLEIAQVLRRFHLAGELEEARARQALRDVQDLDERYPHDPFSPAYGSCATSRRPTTPHTSPWPRHSAHDFSPRTPGSRGRPADTAARVDLVS